MELKDLEKLIIDTKSERDWFKQQYQKYLTLDLPIQKRKFDDSTKVNNKIENPFRTEIVDQVVGYLFGNPIAYSIQDYSDATHDYFNRFLTRNTIADLDAETGVRMSATGVSYRLAYIDTEGYERLALIPSHEAYVFEDREGESVVGFRDYKDGDERIIEIYDDTTTYIYNFDNEKLKLKSEEPHGFDYCPLIKFKNNDQEYPDFHKVETMIDAYDKLVSDAQNELEEFRLAYMKFVGFQVDAEEVEKAKRAGGFEIPDGGDIDFITKNINDVFLENQKNTLNENIYKFSKSVDMSDEKFSGGTQSGESRKWKLLTLENRAIVKERKFTKALRYQWKVLCSSFAKRGFNIDYLDINAMFTRNVPIELTHEADIQTKLYGLVSDELRLSLFSQVDNVKDEMDRIEAKKENLIYEDYEDEQD